MFSASVHTHTHTELTLARVVGNGSCRPKGEKQTWQLPLKKFLSSHVLAKHRPRASHTWQRGVQDVLKRYFIAALNPSFKILKAWDERFRTNGWIGVYINKGTWHLFYKVIEVREFLEFFTQGILRGDTNKSYILTVYYNSKGAFIYLFHASFLVTLISITSIWQINGKVAWLKMSQWVKGFLRIHCRFADFPFTLPSF